MERNTYLYRLCRTSVTDLNVCYDLDFLTATCEIFPWTLMKLVRLKLSLMKPFLEDPEISKHLHVIYLVRDPRAVINSRRSTVGWCKESSHDCYSPAVLCDDMASDLQTAREFQKLYPNKMHILRYEDMANDPYNQTQKLLEAIGLDYNKKMKTFLNSHTTVEHDKPWTTSRDSKKRLLYWTKSLPWEDVKEVQQSCSSTMLDHGYKTVNSLNSLSLENVLNPLDDIL